MMVVFKLKAFRANKNDEKFIVNIVVDFLRFFSKLQFFRVPKECVKSAMTPNQAEKYYVFIYNRCQIFKMLCK